MALSWYEVLVASRPLPEAGFTARDLASSAGIKESSSGRSTGEQIASAWLSKFQRWGYALPSGQKDGGMNIWQLTKWGMKVDEPKKKRGSRGEQV